MPMIKKSTQKWKDGNSNYNVKVSSATIAKLKNGTKASNIAAANKPGASAEFKEAVRRFYGKNSVGPTKTPNGKPVYVPMDKTPKGPKIDRGNPKPTQAQMDAAKKNSSTKKAASITATRSEQKKPTAGQMAKAAAMKQTKQAAAINATRKESMPKVTDRSKLKPKAKPSVVNKIKTMQRKGM